MFKWITSYLQTKRTQNKLIQTSSSFMAEFLSLGSGLIEFQSQNKMVAAKATADRNTFGDLS